jgi:broad specificity phosphatase PhoE
MPLKKVTNNDPHVIEQLIKSIRNVHLSAPAIAFIRHSERHPIGDFYKCEDAELTEDGEKAAFLLGQLLPTNRKLNVISSTVNRCFVTACKIAEGFEKIGGSARIIGKSNRILGNYVLNQNEVSRHLNSMGDKFVREWFDGRMPGIIKSRDDAALEQLQLIHDIIRQASPETLTVIVSHDWNIMLVRETFLGIRHEQAGWAGYLDGPVISNIDNKLQINWRSNSSHIEIKNDRFCNDLISIKV